MKDDKIDFLIESANTDKKEAARKELHSRLDLSASTEQDISKRHKHIKSYVFGAVGICAVCCAIIVPIALKKSPATTPPQSRYCYSTECSYAYLGCNLKEYAKSTGKNILYLDWYAEAEECVTEKYFLGGDKDDIVYISESITNEETGDQVSISVMDIYTSVDVFDVLHEIFELNYEYEDVRIYSIYNIALSVAYFEYDGYKYYVQLHEPPNAQAVVDIAKSML